MNKEDSYIIKTVFEDLIFIKESWDQNIDDASLRRSSTVLRMLLVHGNLSKAWRSVGLEKQPKIYAPSLEETINSIEFKKIVFAQAGGANYKGLEIMSALQVNYAMTPEQIRERAKRGPEAVKKAFWLTEYLKSVCIIINGQQVNRNELIEYVANKLGGAHIDTSRNLNKELEKKFIELDKLGEQIKLADKNSIYFELLSIGQSLVNSKDIGKFIKKVKELKI